MTDERPLAGKIALVTGSSAGVGRTIAKAMAAAGADTVVHGRTPDRVDRVVETITAAGGAASGVCADLMVVDQVYGLVEQVAATKGRIDILVGSGAGVAPHMELKFFHQMDRDRIEDAAHRNWLCKAHLIRAALDVMIPQGYGKIINITTDAGRIPTAIESVEGGAAAALMQMTRVIARECGRYGIRLNNIAFGPLVDVGEGDVQGGPKSEPGSPASLGALQALAKRRMFPVGSADIASTVLFLSAASGDNITGQTLSVNGGLSMPA
jgi:3-oxoacyl-[acyl-carrier protein] reductase